MSAIAQGSSNSSKPDFSKMSNEEKVAWIQGNADKLGLDLSKIKEINLNYMDVNNVVGMTSDGVPIIADGGTTSPWGGAFHQKSGTMYLFAEAFEPALNLNIPLTTDSTGYGVLDSVTRNYTAMENLVHTFGHETAHSLGYDTKGIRHIDGERMGMDAVDRFRGM